MTILPLCLLSRFQREEKGQVCEISQVERQRLQLRSYEDEEGEGGGREGQGRRILQTGTYVSAYMGLWTWDDT